MMALLRNKKKIGRSKKKIKVKENKDQMLNIFIGFIQH